MGLDRSLRLPIALAFAFIAGMLLLVYASTALGAVPSLLTEFPPEHSSGAGANRLSQALGIAADPNGPGDVYAAEPGGPGFAPGNRPGNSRVDQFTARGQFVRAWGWGVADGSAELQRCDQTSGCREGLAGSGPGQFNAAEAVAVDGDGHVFVAESASHRVQEFNLEGEFLLMFGSGVDKGPNHAGNICTAAFLAEGDECGAGAAGTADGELAAEEYVSRLAAAPGGDQVYVGEGERIQAFDADGAFDYAITLPGGDQLTALAAGADGDLYVSFAGQPAARKVKAEAGPAQFIGLEFEEEPAHQPLAGAAIPRALAVAGNGDLFATMNPIQENEVREPAKIIEFAPDGRCLNCLGNGEGGQPGFDRTSEEIQQIHSSLRAIGIGEACGVTDIYQVHYQAQNPTESSVRIFGEAPDPQICPVAQVAPEIAHQFVNSTEATSASVGAQINPQFWATTRYLVEYGPGPCDLGGCAETGPVSLTSELTGAPVATEAVELSGLAPATTYHYRFVAATEFGPGEEAEVMGEGGGPGSAGTEGTFTTLSTAVSAEACPENQAYRTGPSALLPDCRAYEMVSPVDKEGGDILTEDEVLFHVPAKLDQSSLDGNKMTFSSYRSFGDAESAPYSTQYVAARDPQSGWVSHPVSPPRGRLIYEPATNNEFKVFSDDLCEGWLQSQAELPLDTGAPPGFSDIFRRQDGECGDVGFEAANTQTPPSINGKNFELELQGVSGHGPDSETAFIANGKIAPGGSGENLAQLYVSEGGNVVFACVLPDGEDYEGSCAAGGQEEGVTEAKFRDDRTATVTNALSASGRNLYWTGLRTFMGSNGIQNERKIYLRENPTASGTECVTPESPCTVPVSESAEETVGGAVQSQFLGASTDGTEALFATAGRLFKWTLAGEETREIAGGFVGLLGISSDLGRIYFASEEVLSSANAEGRAPSAGAANLYFYEEGKGFKFVGPLAGKDRPGTNTVAGGVTYPISPAPYEHAAEVSSSGLNAVFESYGRFTDYDNRDATTGEADTEVYLYNAAADGGQGKVVCVSCDPTGLRPHGQEYRGTMVNVAARISPSESILYTPRTLSDNGRRVFFDSFDSLVPRDVNGTEDAYEWEAPGEGGCSPAASTYSPQDAGCVDLISTGTSTFPSEFLDASPTGGDVFFTTLSSLVAQDPGLVDVYDARVEGGLPSPSTRGVPCSGEECQAAPPESPGSPVPGSSSQRPGNPAPSGAICPRGRHRVKKGGKTRCIKNQSKPRRHVKKKSKDHGKRGKGMPVKHRHADRDGRSGR
jgi:hypothetical protein